MIKDKKTKIATILTIITALGILTSGCVSNESNGFRIISREKNINGEIIQEVVDEDTGVHYYINTEFRQGFMSPVYNSDGTIKIDK